MTASPDAHSDPGSVPIPGGLLEGRQEGRSAFVDLIRQALQVAAQQGWKRMVWSDPDFLDWPLGERASIEALGEWSAQGRSLHLLAQDFSELRLAHPRFVQWRTTWSHIVEARATGRAAGSDLPSALWSPVWTLERLDFRRNTVVATADAARRVMLAERLDSEWQQASPSFPASVLGL